jgi:uncharacterized protein
MIIEGGFTVKAPIEKLFDFLMKPETVMMCIPGTESVKIIDDNSFECIVKQRVGIISVKLKFVTKKTREERPSHAQFEGEGEDMTKLGHFKQKTVLNLKEVAPGEVEFSYAVDVAIVGKLAMFGDRVMKQKAKDTEKAFTKNLQEKLATMA